MDTIYKIILVIQTLKNFPVAFVDKSGLLKRQIIYKVRHGNMQFIARAGTEDMAEIVVVTSGHEYNLGLIKLPAHPTVVDLGSHIGSFSVWIAKEFNNKGNIIAFEPDKGNFELLLKNLKLNKIKSVQAKKVAISNYNGRGFLKIENINTDAYHLDAAEKKRFNTNVSTLPKALRSYKIKNIDLLKMDVEGGEYLILKHRETLEYLAQNVHYIFMEYHVIDNGNGFKTISKLINKKFDIIYKRKNIIALENVNWKNA